MRYFVGFLITIGLLFLLIIMLVSGGGGSKSKKVPTTSKPLDSYAETTTVAKMTVDGPIDADPVHYKVEIIVGRDKIIYDKIQGYQRNVVDHQEFENNQDAYLSFLKALGYVGFTRGDTSSSLKDERGHCPADNRYVFELEDNGDEIQHFWTTDCGNVKSYLGNREQTVELFKRQVPNIDNLDTGVAF